jgi:hypothetical protein
MEDFVLVGSLPSEDILVMEPSILLKLCVMFCRECKTIFKITDRFAIPFSCFVWPTDLPELAGFAASDNPFAGWHVLTRRRTACVSERKDMERTSKFIDVSFKMQKNEILNLVNSASSSDRSNRKQGEEVKAMQNAAALSSSLEAIGHIRNIFQ